VSDCRQDDELPADDLAALAAQLAAQLAEVPDLRRRYAHVQTLLARHRGATLSPRAVARLARGG
jgi:hypothetical protein